jgi:hypothetical protein
MRIEMLEADVIIGRATNEQVEECRRAYESLCDVDNPIKNVIVVEKKVEPTSSVKTREFDATPKQLTATQQLLLEQLKTEQDSIDYQKRELSNSLHNYPPGTNCKHITDKILNLRDAWIEIGDRIRFVAVYGKLPEDEPVLENDYGKDLPSDKYELHKQISNLKINLKKWSDKMETSKSVGKQNEYRQKVAIGSMKLEVMQSKFDFLKK